MNILKRLVARLLFGTRLSYFQAAKQLEDMVGRERATHLLFALCDGFSSGATEFERYIAAEKLTTAVYSKFKFSEFSRIFLEDKEFLQYYERFMDVGNWHSFDRKFTLNQLLKLTLNLDGDIAECGVYKGASAFLMCKAHRNSDRTIHLFDSFEGLSTPEECDGDYWTSGDLRSTRKSVEESLAEFSNYRIYEGWIPDKFTEVSDKRFSFVHIDVDLLKPTLAAIEFFYPRLLSGGLMLMDDYGFASCPGAKKAADDYFRDMPESIIMLSTGQAFVLKK